MTPREIEKVKEVFDWSTKIEKKIIATREKAVKILNASRALADD